jgi:2-dehydro-3-deoxyphosphooctonate aldolase (KDO 8-P synthase)
MKLCGFDVGLDQPLLPDRRPLRPSSPADVRWTWPASSRRSPALGIPFIFKGSFDKANRSSGTSQRGVGMERGPEDPGQVRRQLQRAHADRRAHRGQVAEVASVVDVLQTPAFLCRQTDFIRAVAQSGKPVNIKKGQFLRPGT